MSVNISTLVGRLTRNPKIIENKNGGKTVLLTVAVERSYKDKDGNRPTDFIPVKAFIQDKAKSNGPFDYMAKGQLVAIEAELRSSQYEKDGETVYGLDVVVKQNGVTLLERAKDASTPAPAKKAEVTTEAPEMEISEDDLPF